MWSKKCRKQKKKKKPYLHYFMTLGSPEYNLTFDCYANLPFKDYWREKEKKLKKGQKIRNKKEEKGVLREVSGLPGPTAI